MFLFRHRTGTTLIELLLFIALIGTVSVALLPLLFTSTENRLLQQTVSIVEQNGAQILQTLAYRIRHAEAIVDPPLQSTGAVLTLQTGSGSMNPTIVGISSGSLLLIRHTTKQVLSSSQVAVDKFIVRNTSVSASRQSVYIRFRVSRTIRLQLPHIYSKNFEAVFTLFPDDEKTGDECGCASPGCDLAGNYLWQVCEETCLTAQTPMECRS